MGGIDMKQFNLEEYFNNPSRKVVTRDGRNARIICTNAKNDYPIVALIETPNGKESQPCGYKKDGTFAVGEELSCDLFFAPEKHEGWINVYKSESDWSLGTSIWQTEEEAKEWIGATDYVTTIKIEWEE